MVLSYEAPTSSALAASGEGPVLDLLLQPPSRWAEVPLPLLGVILLGPGVPLATIGLLWGLFSVDRESVLPLLIAGLPCIMLLGRSGGKPPRYRPLANGAFAHPRVGFDRDSGV